MSPLSLIVDQDARAAAMGDVRQCLGRRPRLLPGQTEEDRRQLLEGGLSSGHVRAVTS